MNDHWAINDLAYFGYLGNNAVDPFFLPLQTLA